MGHLCVQGRVELNRPHAHEAGPATQLGSIYTGVLNVSYSLFFSLAQSEQSHVPVNSVALRHTQLRAGRYQVFVECPLCAQNSS